jgi:hypothetical protein
MNEIPDKRTKRYILLRQLFDYSMGIIYLCVAILFAFADKFGFSFTLFPGKGFQYFFAVLIGLYGIWRLYRGYKRNYV